MVGLAKAKQRDTLVQTFWGETSHVHLQEKHQELSKGSLRQLRPEGLLENRRTREHSQLAPSPHGSQPRPPVTFQGPKPQQRPFLFRSNRKRQGRIRALD